MKTILLVILTMFSYIVSANAAYELVGQSTSSNSAGEKLTSYFDSESVKKIDNIVEVKYLVNIEGGDRKDKKGNSIKSYVQNRAYNCVENTMSIKAETRYEEGMGQGVVVSTVTSPNQPFGAIAEKTANALVFKKLCTPTSIAAAPASIAAKDSKGIANPTPTKPEEPILDGMAEYNNKQYDVAMEKFKREAANGNAKAQTYIGHLHASGQGVKKNVQEAKKWYELAAAQGYAQAQERLGHLASDEYDRRRVGESGYEKIEAAKKWYGLAAAQNFPAAQYGMGKIYYYGDRNNKEAMKWYLLAAAQGFADAETSLGALYVDGAGVEKNYAEAMKWIRKSADRGSQRGQDYLGYMYVKGLGVEKNFVEAKKWYELAAAQGFHNAQFNMGKLYLEGLGVNKNDLEAMKWFKLAADQGHTAAQREFDQLIHNDKMRKDPQYAAKYRAEVSCLERCQGQFEQCAIQYRSQGGQICPPAKNTCDSRCIK